MNINSSENTAYNLQDASFVLGSTENCLKMWRENIFGKQKRKELSPGELNSMFQQKVIKSLNKILI
jgi:hypothetical protein